MTWIKVEDFKPPTHDVILFRDRHHNEHYGVLCGDYSVAEKRNKFWCHIYQQSYEIDDVIYWCEIPINKHLLREHNDLSFKVNAFLWSEYSKIEKTILSEFKEHQKENPEWPVENFVEIAVRNCLYRMMELMRVSDE